MIPETASTPSDFPRWLGWLLILLGGIGGTYATFYPTLHSGFRRMQSDAGDPVLNHYFLEHSWRWVSQKDYRPSFWSPGFFYPTPLVYTYSETLIGAAPLYWGLRLLCPEVLAWQLWMMLVSLLTYLAMAVVLRWFGVHPILAVLGGYLFAYGAPRTEHLGHYHLQTHFFAPFVVYYLVQWLKSPTRKAWFLVLMLSACQLLASIHLGWFLVFALGLSVPMVFAFDLATAKRAWVFLRQNPAYVIATTAIWFAGLWAFFRTYYLGNQGFRRVFFEMLYFMPTPIAWLTESPGTLWGESLAPSPEPLTYQERRLFAGFGILAIVAIALLGRAIPRRILNPERAFLRSGLLTCAVMMILATRYSATITPWWLIVEVVPGSDSIRVPGRICFSMLLLGIIAGLIGFQAVLRERVPSRSRRTCVYIFLLIVCISEQLNLRLTSFEHSDSYKVARELSQEIKDADVVLFVHSPYDERDLSQLEIIAMWAALDAGIPTTNGYSGRWPTDYPNCELTGDVAAQIAWFGNQWHGRLLVIHLGEPLQKKWYRIDP